ncbi:hypothetical protein Ctha_0598 [Chloroherpeton thalassium ATCC 35110]|uniref:NB-ARC domain-containing protein n=1 Tax=Chloroherpeton thalassium (strain ATCC 35110 / GB-78) TaxID=517418 RepID=B3QVB4_CHLT3|nr:NB-ARC domain-containing protein [Chloroherpeton thalassium]ACF13068.1 hypothetical protein Ctha_0598 [Chloroherpeton thalassium ATCC 35110]
MKQNIITLDGNRNIVLQDISGSAVTINTADAEDILQKLEALQNEQLAVLRQMAEEQSETLPDLFKKLLRGVASEKNVVHGNISARSVKMGDEVHYHYYILPAREKLPKKLTSDIPLLPASHIVGREEELMDLRKLLVQNREALLLNGLGGIGKTTLAQVFAHTHFADYAHIAWITQEAESDFLLDFISAEDFRENLAVLPALTEPADIFHAMLRKLNAIEDKPNLLIVDNANKSVSQFKDMLPCAPEWHILLTSRTELTGFTPKRLDFLSPENAFLLFKKHYPIQNGLTDTQITELIELVDCHTLTIEILAKTAEGQNYPFEKLKNALKHDARSGVEIYRSDTPEKTVTIEKITSYLCAVFSLSGLEGDELWLLQQLCALPAEYHEFSLLQTLLQPKKRKKISFLDKIIHWFHHKATNEENSVAPALKALTKKGWLLKNAETNSYKMHKVVGEVVRKKALPTIADIEPLLNAVTEMLSLDQTKDNPIEKFPWIPFGNAVLEVADLQPALAAEEEKNIAVLQNNLALRLREFGKHEAAKTLLEKAVKSAEKNSARRIRPPQEAIPI